MSDFTLWKRWKFFLNIILDPIVILLFIVTMGLGAYMNNTTNDVARLVLSVLLALLSSAAGARLHDQWTGTVQRQLLSARGRSAVRSLKALLSDAVAMERRLARCQAMLPTFARLNQARQVIQVCLEEAREKSLQLADDATLSIEDWTDIVPEAENAPTEIGRVRKLADLIGEKEDTLERLKAQLDRERQSKSAETEQLRIQIERNEQDLKSANLALLEQRLRFLSLPPGTKRKALPTADEEDTAVLSERRKCAACKTYFYSTKGRDKCDRCAGVEDQ